MARHPLDGSLFYLGRDVPGVIDLVMLRRSGVKAVLLFGSRPLAEAHLAALGATGPAHGVLEIEAQDFRAKEELCLAGLAQGATEAWFDLQPGGQEPGHRQLLLRALAYIRSFKNETTCL